jgi:2-methylisocitrate lyase-like PEP mutase family enzyme
MKSERSQKQKAEDLLRLHDHRDLLILPNVWNPIGARILATKGYPAVATASAALSASLGFADGERIQRSTLVEFLGRIARSVDVPVTADIEAGYADPPAELEETTRQVIASGVVGINILGSPKAAPLSVLRGIGVNRVSFGPFVFRSCLRRFVESQAIHQADARKKRAGNR